MSSGIFEDDEQHEQENKGHQDQEQDDNNKEEDRDEDEDGDGEAVVEAEGQGHDEARKEQNWAKLNRQRKRKAGLFACLPDLSQRLVLSAVAVKPGMSLLYESFKCASSEFDLEQQRKAAAGQERTFRVVETARGHLINKCFEQCKEISHKCELALPKEFYTLQSRSFLFRMLSSFLCNVHSAVRRFHFGFPYLLFRILDGQAAAKQVYSASHCLHDELSSKFFALYPTVRDGTCTEALALLQSLAITAEVDSCHFLSSSLHHDFFLPSLLTF